MVHVLVNLLWHLVFLQASGSWLVSWWWSHPSQAFVLTCSFFQKQRNILFKKSGINIHSISNTVINNNSVGTQANKNDASIKTHIYCDQLNKKAEQVIFWMLLLVETNVAIMSFIPSFSFLPFELQTEQVITNILTPNCQSHQNKMSKSLKILSSYTKTLYKLRRAEVV